MMHGGDVIGSPGVQNFGTSYSSSSFNNGGSCGSGLGIMSGSNGPQTRLQFPLFHPSEAVLLHIRYVMENISDTMDFTDVTLETSRQRIRAHRAILASHSTFLRQVLIDHQEEVGVAEEPVIVCKDISSDHVKLMMEFFYTGKVNLNSEKDIQPLKEVCMNLGVSSLMARLEELSFSLNFLPNYPSNGHEERVDDLNKSKESMFSDVTVEAPNAVALTGGDIASQVIKPEERFIKGHENGEENNLSTIEEEEEATRIFDTSLLNDDAPDDNSNNEVDSNTKSSSDIINGLKLKKASFPCNKCSSKFYTKDSLVAHMRVHEGNKPFSCDICQASLSTKSHLKIHMRKHNGEKPYCCATCKKSFSDQSAFKRHQLIHSDKKHFQCNICKKAYTDSSTYRRHVKEKHNPDNKKQFACSVCKKEFFRKETLVSHVVKVHRINEKRETGKPALTIDKFLLQSKENRSKWSSVNCPQCDKIFYKQSAMEVHLRSHTGDKPYVCEICGKKFARSNNLKLHKRIHSGEKPYKCTLVPDECNKAFSDVSALRRHLRTHTGEKPYECGKCGRFFAQQGTAKGHSKTCKANANNPENDKKVAKQVEMIRNSHKKNSNKIESPVQQSNFILPPVIEDSLSVIAGSEPPIFNTDTLDSVRAACM